MGKDQSVPVVVTSPKKDGPNPVIWVTLLAVLAFPVSVVSATLGIVLARRGFARANLAYLTTAFAAAAAVAYMLGSAGLMGYVNSYLWLIESVGLTSIEYGETNLPLFVTAGLAVGFLMATGFAAVWRKQHGDDEEWLEQHPENLDALSGLFVKRRNAKLAAANEVVIDKIAEGDWFGPNEVGLGYVLESVEPGRKIEPVGLPDLVGGSVSHSLILGSSGRGKSVSITRQAFDAIKKGDPVLVVDAKGDGDLAAKLGAYAEEFGRPFYHFSIPSSTSAPYVGPSSWGRACYDPAGLSAGNHTRRRDFMMNARDWKGAPAVYSDKTRDWLSRALWVDNVVAEVNGGRPLETMPQATFSRIAELMSPMTCRHYLREAANRYGSEAIDKAFGTTTYEAMMAELEMYATTTDQTGESARMSHAAWLRTFMSSITGPFLRDTGDERTIDIARIVEEQAVCVFDLATDQYREEAPALARLVVADLLSYISSVGKADGLRLRVFLDEFAAVGGDESANVLARARSAGVSFTLSTQTLSDLRDVSDAFEGQVLTNSLNLLVHNASTWDEAERLAGMTGQIEQQRVTRSERTDGVDGARTKSVMTERRYRVEPSEFMEMGVGELVKISQVERGSGKAVKVKVVMPPRIEGTTFTVDSTVEREPLEEVSEYVMDAETVPSPIEPENDTDANETAETVETVQEVDGPEAPIFGSFFGGEEAAGDSGVAEKPTVEVVVDDESVSPTDFVTESEEERRARLQALAASGPLFEPSVEGEAASTVTPSDPAPVEPDAPVRPTRVVRRRSDP